MKSASGLGVVGLVWLMLVVGGAAGLALPAVERRSGVLDGGVVVAGRDFPLVPAPAAPLAPRASAATPAVVYDGNEIDLPAFITAIFNGLANTILAAGDAASNTIAATGGMLANVESKGAVTPATTKTNSTVVVGRGLIGEEEGRSIGEQAGEMVGRELGKEIVGVLAAAGAGGGRVRRGGEMG